MTLDMMFANFQTGNVKADGKQDSANKEQTEKEEALKAEYEQGDAKQAFAEKMISMQKRAVDAAWKSFKEKVDELPLGTPPDEAAEKIFKQCCDSAIATVLLAVAITM